MSIATAGRIGARLEHQGLAERYPDEEDGRSVIVAITEQGEAAVIAVLNHRRMLIREALQTLAPECLPTVVQFIEGIAADMGGEAFARHSLGLVPS